MPLALTKALTCLSKFGDELSVYATPDSLTFSATNSAKSAYSRFKYDKAFFSRYRLGNGGALDQMEEDPMLTGQLLTKVNICVVFYPFSQLTRLQVIARHTQAQNCGKVGGTMRNTDIRGTTRPP